jgi:hypothetical protein
MISQNATGLKMWAKTNPTRLIGIGRISLLPSRRAGHANSVTSFLRDNPILVSS